MIYLKTIEFCLVCVGIGGKVKDLMWKKIKEASWSEAGKSVCRPAEV
ncbi:hypothetical protein [Bartonella sp. AC134YNZD]